MSIFFFWRKSKPERTCDVLEALERDISEIEYRLRHSLERSWVARMRVVVIGVASILSSALWFIANLDKHEDRRHVFPLIVSIVVFVQFYQRLCLLSFVVTGSVLIQELVFVLPHRGMVPVWY